ncbi:ABC transporter substrate-binding protein [Limobrevibacterium gyesilva]|uniref:Sugar ABC transporter substrate-binding protein n=1 Tax=Limobrevibacterium gyesilva TaxID=2991712 RepID=A0AA41YIC9_9PROT|nr:sugar ABC transporter substrate-binding protein [Limobrevibacterium gyesilva]MCW3474081.1 sugar ABC transporter substrate-binding protein [Limobrevibacterium gyesilva]
MKRRTLLAGATVLAATPLARPHAQKPVTIRWWYHFDDPKMSPAGLVEQFEKQNPGIKVQAENIPWGGGADYDTRLYTSIIAGIAPDAAMVKFNNLPRLMEMDALAPLDKQIDAWPGRSDISEDLWKLHRAPDGKRYYLPVQFVVLYLYARQDWFAQKNLKLPATFADFEGAAQALTGGERWGFGLRGGAGGHDHWCSFVLGGGARLEKGGLVSPEALAANRWFIGLYTQKHLFPPSAPNDGFQQVIGNMKAGRTAMTIHHIGSANEMTAALGDAITAVPVPRGPQGRGWTTFGDGSNAILAQGSNQEAAWKWISFLSTGEANVAFNKLSGQVTVTTSGAQHWAFQPQRFMDATTASLPIAATLPPTPQTADFTRTVWPQTTQKALLGQITPDDMMRVFEKHFFG